MMVDVEVTFEYVAEQEDELNIKVGDIIKNVTMSEGGWWEGELNGKVGMFPDNFVKVIEKAKPKEKEDQPKRGQSVKALASKIKDDVHMGAGGPMKKESQPSGKRRKAKVVFSYDPENADELKVEVGDIVEIIKQKSSIVFHLKVGRSQKEDGKKWLSILASKYEEEGWWEGSLNGKVGVFPSNFVEEIEDAEPEKVPVVEERVKEAPHEVKKKVIGGVGLGNIFEGGPIKLRTTSTKNSEKVSHPPQEPVTKPPVVEEDSKPIKREKPYTYMLPKPAPRRKPACSMSFELHSNTSNTMSTEKNIVNPINTYQGSLACPNSSSFNSDSYLQCDIDTNIPVDIEKNDVLHSEDSWVNIMYGSGSSDVTVTDLDDTDIISPQKYNSDQERQKQLGSYTIQSGLNRLSKMQLIKPQSSEENLIEFADIEVDNENKENLLFGRKCVSAIDSLGTDASMYNSSNNNVDTGHAQFEQCVNELSKYERCLSKSVDSLKLHLYLCEQESEPSVCESRANWLSENKENHQSAMSFSTDKKAKKKDSLFRKVMNFSMFKKRSKMMIPAIGESKDIPTAEDGTVKCGREVPTLMELCRIKLKPVCLAPSRLPLKELKILDLLGRSNQDQSSGSFEVSVDSMDSMNKKDEPILCERKNDLKEFFSDDDQEDSVLAIMSSDDVHGENEKDSCARALGADLLQEKGHKDEKLASSSYLGSLNKSGQLSPFIKKIAEKYHLFDPVKRKWTEGYMDEHVIEQAAQLGASDKEECMESDQEPDNSHTSICSESAPESEIKQPWSEFCVNKQEWLISQSTKQGDASSPVSPSWNILPPGSVKEKVSLYENMYVNDMIDQVIQRAMHRLSFEQCLEEYGSVFPPALKKKLEEDYTLCANVTHKTMDDIEYPGTEDVTSSPGMMSCQNQTDTFLKEITEHKGSKYQAPEERHLYDSCAQSHEMVCQIEDSLHSAMTDFTVEDTDYTTAMSDPDGSCVISTLSDSGLDDLVPKAEQHTQSAVMDVLEEYVDLPEIIKCHDFSNQPYPLLKSSGFAPDYVRQTQEIHAGPWVSPIQSRARKEARKCTMKEPLTADIRNDSMCNRCTIGTQTPDSDDQPRFTKDTSRDRSEVGQMEDRATSPIKELLSYDTTLDDSALLNTSDIAMSPLKVCTKPRYSSSPIKRSEEPHGKEITSDLYVACSKQVSHLKAAKSNHPDAAKATSPDVNAVADSFRIEDCTEKRRKRFSWKKLFRPKVKEPVILVAYKQQSDLEMEEDPIDERELLNCGLVRSDPVKTTAAQNTGGHALLVEQNLSQSHGTQTVSDQKIIYRLQPFTEDFNTVETFYDRNYVQENIPLRFDRFMIDNTKASRDEDCNDNVDEDDRYSLDDIEIILEDEQLEQERIDRCKDIKVPCNKCDLSDMHIHGQGLQFEGTDVGNEDITDSWRSSDTFLHDNIGTAFASKKQGGVTDEEGSSGEESEEVSIDSPNLSASAANAIRNSMNLTGTPDSEGPINLDSFLQDALRPIDDLLDESMESNDMEEEGLTPRLDRNTFFDRITESPEKYPSITYISPSVENILAEDDAKEEGTSYVMSIKKPSPISDSACRSNSDMSGDFIRTSGLTSEDTDTSGLSMEYVLSLEKKYLEECGVSEPEENTPQNTPSNTPSNEKVLERYPSFTYCHINMGDSFVSMDQEAEYKEKVLPIEVEEGQIVSSLSSSAEGVYNYEDSFESSSSVSEENAKTSHENREGDEKKNGLNDSKNSEEIVEVDPSLEFSQNQSHERFSEIPYQSFSDHTLNITSDDVSHTATYGSDRILSFLSDQGQDTSDLSGLQGACALPSDGESEIWVRLPVGTSEQRSICTPEWRGHSSYSMSREEVYSGLSDSGLLLSFNSSPEITNDIIDV